MATATPPTQLAVTAAKRPAQTAPTHDLNVSSDDLRELMEALTQTTQRLQTTHVVLQKQVVQLQHELAEANAALRRSEALAALGEVAAGIAHEVRNPLGSIQLYVQMLAEDLADRPAQAELCAKINRAVVGLDAIVRDVLAFSRDTTIHPEPVAADEILERSLANCHSILTKDIHIERQNSRETIEFQADPNLIVQAISNVIRNAAEAMQESASRRRELCLGVTCKKVRCPSGKSEMRIVLSVQDTGPGIPPEVLERIFNPFFTTRKTGTGLGLAIVHRIVDAHGGHIAISNNPTGGTRVDICLPSAPPKRKLTPHPEPNFTTNTRHAYRSGDETT